MAGALIIAIAAPAVIIGLAAYLSWTYGDGLFGLDWPGHNLNDPHDPRILKLELDSSAKIERKNVQQPR